MIKKADTIDTVLFSNVSIMFTTKARYIVGNSGESKDATASMEVSKFNKNLPTVPLYPIKISTKVYFNDTYPQSRDSRTNNN